MTLPTTHPVQTPFDSVENAQAYIQLLIETLVEAKKEVAADAASANAPRGVVTPACFSRLSLPRSNHHAPGQACLLSSSLLRRLPLASSRPDAQPRALPKCHRAL